MFGHSHLQVICSFWGTSRIKSRHGNHPSKMYCYHDNSEASSSHVLKLGTIDGRTWHTVNTLGKGMMRSSSYGRKTSKIWVIMSPWLQFVPIVFFGWVTGLHLTFFIHCFPFNHPSDALSLSLMAIELYDFTFHTTFSRDTNDGARKAKKDSTKRGEVAVLAELGFVWQPWEQQLFIHSSVVYRCSICRWKYVLLTIEFLRGANDSVSLIWGHMCLQK